MMKTPASFLLVIATFLAATGARAQFLNFPAADRVLGASDFITAGPTTTTSSCL